MIKENQNLKEIKKINHNIRMKLQNVVVGRDKEIEDIKMQFDKVIEGDSSLTIISGGIGVGKTALVKTSLMDMTRINAICVYGKFEQYKDEEPYIAITQIVRNITNYILTLPKEKLRLIRSRIIKELGKDVALIISIVPQIEGIIGKQRKINVTDYQKLKRRLEKVFQKFIYVAAKELFPLVIFIDDLQWADKPSWDIIESINETLTQVDLYMIMAYRNNKEEYRVKVEELLKKPTVNGDRYEIDLGDISKDHIKSMLIEIFEGEIDNVNDLALMIYSKTLGNPLYIKQIIQLLLDNKGIYYNFEEKKWHTKSESLHTINLPTGIEDIINRRISSLSKETKELLEMGACIGNRFDIELLKEITENKYKNIEDMLKDLCDEGLIVDTLEHIDYKKLREFEFFHDRIYENIYENMNREKREQLHYNIAIRLLNHTDKNYVEENIVSITAHLLNCKNIIRRKRVKDRETIDLYFAGIKAKQVAAIEHALKLFSFCEELLDSSCWEEDYFYTYKIKIELAQCEFICGQYDKSKVHFEEMLGHAANEEELAEIKKRYMMLYSYIGDYSKVIDLGIEALKHLGFDFHIKNYKIAILQEMGYGKILFRNSRLEGIKNAPILSDKRIIDIQEILTIMAPIANIIDKNLFTLIVLKLSNLSAKHGNSLYSAVGYAGYSLIVGNVIGNFKKSNEIKTIALRLAEIFDESTLKCITYFVIGTFVEHWISSSKKSFTYLQKAFEYGTQSGEFLFSGFTITAMIHMKYAMGESLNELEKFLTINEGYGKKMDHDILLRLIRMERDHIKQLKEDVLLKDRLVREEEIDKLDIKEKMNYYVLKLHRLYLEGKIDEAYEVSQKTIKMIGTLMGYIMQVNFVFYYLLVNLEKIKNQNAKEYKNNYKAINKYKRKLKVWSEMSPTDHLGKYLLIEALYSSFNNNNFDAAKKFDEAIQNAKENNNIQLEAMANFLAANYYSNNRKIAKVYALDAYFLFNEWGATKIAKRISELFNIQYDIAAGEASATITVDEMTDSNESEAVILYKESLNLHQKELERLELSSSFEYFLNRVCKEVGADSAAILLEKDDEIKLKYNWQKGNEVIKYQEGMDIEQIQHIARKVVLYSTRTYEEVIINEKPIEGPFESDDYIRSKEYISIICLPLKYKGIFIGFIYLESYKNHCFDSKDIEFIKALSFYLVAKQALKKEAELKEGFIVESVKFKLTDRETEVLCYIAQGMSNKQIGEKLQLSLSTVKTHIVNLYKKLEVSSRVQAVTKAKALSLIK